MRYVLILAALLAVPAHADEFVAFNGRDTVRLHQDACPAAILEIIPEKHRARFKRASAVVDGQSYGACWTMLPDGQGVLVQYEDRDQGLIPVSDFQREPSV